MPQPGPRIAAVPSIREKIDFLRRADAYPEKPARVETIETHMSWVFLTGAFAYKLKKPVRHPFLDFITLAARRRYCGLEIKLNRRLAPDVYCGLARLAHERGRLRLGGSGATVDWLVKMRRLPAQRMLDAAIRDRTVSAADLRNVSHLLTAFYRGLAPVAMSARAYLRRVETDVRDCAAELARPQWRLAPRQVERIARAQTAFLAERGALLEERARRGRIVEAHGDLRPEHVCLMVQPVIIDCLEFKREFRLLDPVDELSFLAMECERLGSPAGDSILRNYLRAVGDDVPEPLMLFYRTYRACLRAKLSIWHLADHAVKRDKWRRRAREYLELAASYCAHW